MSKNDIKMTFRVRDDGSIVVKNASKKIRNELNKTSSKAKSSSKAMSKSFKSVGVALAGVAVAAMSINKAMSFSKSIIDYGDQLNKLNLRLGVSVEMLDKLRKIGALGGVSIDEITNSIRRMQRNLDTASKGTGTISEDIKNLGLNVNDLLNLSPDEQFLSIAEAIDKIEDPTLKSAAANKILGMSGVKLISMFKDLRGEVNRTTTAFDNEKAKKMADFNDEMQRLSDNLQDIFVENSDSIINGATGIANALVGLADTFGNAPEKIDKDLNAFSRSWQKIKKIATGQRGWNPLNWGKNLDGIRHPISNQSPKSTPTSKRKRTTSDGPGADILIEQNRLSDALKALAQSNSIELTRILEGDRAADIKARESHYDQLRILAHGNADLLNQIEQTRINELLNMQLKWSQEDIELETEKNQKLADERKKAAEQELKQRESLANSINQNISADITDGLLSIIDGSQSASEAFKQMATSIIKDLARIALQKSITNAIGGSDGSGGLGGFITGLLFADGGAIQNGNVIPFAKGGVVKKPTMFPMARGMGLMGEAGPEGVLPLKRGRDGKLGVIAESSNNAPTIIIENKTNTPIEENNIRYDPETNIIRIVLKAMSQNTHGFRNSMKAAVAA